MPLPMPRLDNRTFDQLVDEGRSLLPRLAPGWTDHNYHDPGITLIDLLAWLVEMDMYRLDRTSPAAYRTFLRLVGIEPRPPQVAETVLVWGIESGNNPIKVPQGKRVEDQAGRITFQTTRNLWVSPARLVAVLSGSEESPLDCSQQNKSAGKRFRPFGPEPQVGHALYLGFDRRLAEAQVKMSLYVWANSPETEADLRRRLIEACRAEQAAVKACGREGRRRRADWRQHYSARTVWEYYAGPKEGWTPLARVVDETRGLTLSGAVRFLAPDSRRHVKGGVKAHPDHYFIRCRLLSGYYDCPPEIQHIALNAATARHAVAVKAEEELGVSNSRAGQRFQLRRGPVVPGSTRLRVQVKGADEGQWREEASWDRVGPHDRAYVLSPTTGEIIFGDGRYGRIPPAGAKLVVSYQVGGGASGNVLSGTLTKSLEVAGVSVEQPYAALGGAEAESPAEGCGWGSGL